MACPPVSLHAAMNVSYGQDYLLRAGNALELPAANTPDIAMYLSTETDSTGQPISGSNNAVYTVTFDAEPPGHFFSSLTAYNRTNRFFPTINSTLLTVNWNATTPLMQLNPSGSLTVYLSSTPPGAAGSLERANWMSIPNGKCITHVRGMSCANPLCGFQRLPQGMLSGLSQLTQVHKWNTSVVVESC